MFTKNTKKIDIPIPDWVKNRLCNHCKKNQVDCVGDICDKCVNKTIYGVQKYISSLPALGSTVYCPKCGETIKERIYTEGTAEFKFLECWPFKYTDFNATPEYITAICKCGYKCKEQPKDFKPTFTSLMQNT